jgi:hypothetical protein
MKEVRSMAKLGRPTKFTQAVADEICGRLAEGESLNRICKNQHLPNESTVRGWAMNDYNGFFAKYARARDIALDMMADEVIEIADAGSQDYQRDRLRFDARRWYLSKLAPKRYGDKMAFEHSGNVGIAQLLDAAEQARTPPVEDAD